MNTGLLLSGGMDSLALAWWKRPNFAFTVDYGQLAAGAEISASRKICQGLGIPCEVIVADCKSLGSGDMAGTKPIAEAPASDWWPYRNQLLLTLCAMKAIRFQVTQLWIGTVKSDSQHQDGTPEFIDAMNRLLLLQEGSLSIEAPAINMSTIELIMHSGVPVNFLAWAHSCHKSNVACGDCRGCNKYFKTFAELGYDWT